MATRDYTVGGAEITPPARTLTQADAIRDHVFEAQAIFMDDTTVKLLQKGKGRGKNKSKTARLWVYARDESAWSGAAPPAVWYQFSTNRGAEHPSAHLKPYTGYAHAG